MYTAQKFMVFDDHFMKNKWISFTYELPWGIGNYWKPKSSSLWPSIDERSRMKIKWPIHVQQTLNTILDVMFTVKCIKYKIFWLLNIKIWCTLIDQQQFVHLFSPNNRISIILHSETKAHNNIYQTIWSIGSVCKIKEEISVQ